MIIQRRQFLTGLASLLAAPAIVQAQNIMPVRSIERLLPAYNFDSFDSFNQYYQWVAHDLATHEKMTAAGWEPVPVDLYKTTFRITGLTIDHGDCTLMRRPPFATINAREKEIQLARDLVEVKYTDSVDYFVGGKLVRST